MDRRTERHSPPHCPNQHCASHADAEAPWRWARAGFFTRRAHPHRIQRYRCVDCGRYFSDQTFRTDYWLRRPGLLAETFHALTHCTGFRQLARKHGGSPQTFMALALRLGRHCQLVHERLRPRGELSEPLVLDGFRSHEWSQYHPSEYHLLIGQHSDYVHGFTHSELRRMGRMRPGQRRRRARLEARFGRPDPASVRREVARLLAIVTASASRLEIHSDENPAYPRALAAQRHLREIVHQTTSSRARRDAANALRAVNVFELIARHSAANHKRETIAFSKSIVSALARMWVLVAWRNYVKCRSERRRGPTPAMLAGVCAHRWSVPELLAERLFPERVTLPAAWAEHYWGEVPMRRIPHPRRHTLTYAR